MKSLSNKTFLIALLFGVSRLVMAADTAPQSLSAAQAQLREAREELSRAAARYAELSSKTKGVRESIAPLSEIHALRFIGADDHARIGVVLMPSAKGAVVSAVSPGSPADKAGLRSGDNLISINGKKLPSSSLKSAMGEDIDWVDGDDPGVRAARLALSALKDGQFVVLDVDRQGKTISFNVRAEKRDDWQWPKFAGMTGNSALKDLTELEHNISVFQHENGPNSEHIIIKRVNPQQAEQMKNLSAQLQEKIGAARARIVTLNHDDWRQLHLSSLSPELGRYFGTTRGVLVLERGGKGFTELQAGDVLLSVSDKPVDQVSEAVRGLTMQKAGSAIEVQIMRDKKLQTLRVVAPEHGALFAPPPPPPPPPPAPPPPPSEKRAPIPPPPPPPRHPNAVAFSYEQSIFL